jgi:hypothetical protein
MAFRSLAILVVMSVTAAQSAVAASTASEPKYQIAMAVMADAKWDAIRYDVTSGKTWHIVEGKWAPMKDTGDLPTARYEVHIVPLKNDWGALRIDVLSGRSWVATTEGWTEVGAADAAAVTLPTR